MEVEPAAFAPRPKNCCPISCMLKAALVVLVAVFVLYLPLGDPFNYCTNTTEEHNREVAMCCLCDIYLMLVRVVSKTREMVEFMLCVVMDILHDAKLKFYSILEKIDRNDLCRSICCSDSSETTVIRKENRHPPCRCTKKCK